MQTNASLNKPFVFVLVNLQHAAFSYPASNIAFLNGAIKNRFAGKVRVIALAATETDSTLYKRIMSYEPDLVGFTTYSGLMGPITALSKTLSLTFQIPVIFGGHHISSVPESLPSWVKVGILGEAEKSIVELLDLFLKKEAHASGFATIAGICYHGEAGDVIVVPSKANMPLDSLSPPDYSCFDKSFWKPSRQWFRSESPGIGAGYHASRGCAFQCTFCQESALVRGVRFLSPERMAFDLGKLHDEFGVTQVSFEDSIFGYTPQRVAAYQKALEKRGLLGKMRFSIQGTSHSMTEEMVEALKDLGVLKIFLGMEAGSAKMLAKLKPGPFSVEGNNRAVHNIKKKNLLAHGFFIMGAPEETLEEMYETYLSIASLPLDFVGLSYFVPYPSTVYWNTLEQQGKVHRKMDWRLLRDEESIEFAAYYNTVVPHPHFVEIFSRARTLVRTINQQSIIKGLRQQKSYAQALFKTVGPTLLMNRLKMKNTFNPSFLNSLKY